jgi:hypothetical protein
VNRTPRTRPRTPRESARCRSHNGVAARPHIAGSHGATRPHRRGSTAACDHSGGRTTLLLNPVPPRLRHAPFTVVRASPRLALLAGRPSDAVVRVEPTQPDDGRSPYGRT